MAFIVASYFIIGTVRCTRTIRIQIDFIVDVALNEICELRMGIGCVEIVARPYHLTQIPDERLGLLRECSVFVVECNSTVTGDFVIVQEILFRFGMQRMRKKMEFLYTIHTF